MQKKGPTHRVPHASFVVDPQWLEPRVLGLLEPHVEELLDVQIGGAVAVRAQYHPALPVVDQQDPQRLGYRRRLARAEGPEYENGRQYLRGRGHHHGHGLLLSLIQLAVVERERPVARPLEPAAAAAVSLVVDAAVVDLPGHAGRGEDEPGVGQSVDGAPPLAERRAVHHELDVHLDVALGHEAQVLDALLRQPGVDHVIALVLDVRLEDLVAEGRPGVLALVERDLLDEEAVAAAQQEPAAFRVLRYLAAQGQLDRLGARGRRLCD